jgi:hypothetical protein
MKRGVWAIAVTVALGAVPAAAVSKGGKLYIKSKDTAVLAKPDAKSKTVGKLQPGDEVIWNGAATEDKRFHEIAATDPKKKKVKGFTLQQNLSPSKPQMEILLSKGGKPIDAKSFASSGAATKALTEAGLKYAKRKGETDAAEKARMELASKSIISAEAVAESVGPKKALAYGCKSTGLCP